MAKVIGTFRSRLMDVLFWALTFSGLGLVFVVIALPVMRQRQAMDAQVRQMTQRNRVLAAQNDYLRKEDVALRTDPFYIEKIARRELNLCRPGEMCVAVVPTSMPDAHRVKVDDEDMPRTVDLSRFYEKLMPLAEDGIFRQGALILGAVVFIAAVLLFGREPLKRKA